jgi:hypothetical protein
MYPRPKRPFYPLIATIILLLIAFVISGCTTVKLIADYDEEIDKGITSFYKKMEMHLIGLERNSIKKEALEENLQTEPDEEMRKRYREEIDKAKAEIDYENNVEFYDRLTVDLGYLQVRAASILKNEVTLDQMRLLRENLKLLLSIHQMGISQNDILPLRNGFRAGTTAILKLELAKKRGKKASK